MITLELTEQEARCLIHFAKQGAERVLQRRARRHAAERLTKLKKKYSEQKNLDAVLLAANGGHTELLSGESGRLNNAIYRMQYYWQHKIEGAEIAYAVAERIKLQLPPREDVKVDDCRQSGQ